MGIGRILFGVARASQKLSPGRLVQHQLKLSQRLAVCQYSYHSLSAANRLAVGLQLQPVSRGICTPVAPSETKFVVTSDREVNVEEVEQLLKADQIVLIDVREPKELEESGKIPQSINIPLDQVHQTLALSPQTFEKLYGKKLEPEKIVFHCRSGKRSVTAMAIAQKELGFSRTRHLVGGHNAWVERKSNGVEPEKQKSSQKL